MKKFLIGILLLISIVAVSACSIKGNGSSSTSNSGKPTGSTSHSSSGSLEGEESSSGSLEEEESSSDSSSSSVIPPWSSDWTDIH